MNKWIGSGRLTDDPTIRYGEDKRPFVSFTIMVKRNKKIAEGESPVDFIDCVCTGRNMAFSKDNLYKDKKVEVSGPLRSGHYTDKEGRKIYTKTVHVEDIDFAETKQEEEAYTMLKLANAGNTQTTPQSKGEFMEGTEGDLPFN